jgi:hypothetical protein
LLAHSSLGCCSGSFANSVLALRLQFANFNAFAIRFSVYFTLSRAHYIVSHSNFYLNQCFYSRNRFNYLLAHFRPWLLLWMPYSFEFLILRIEFWHFGSSSRTVHVPVHLANHSSLNLFATKPRNTTATNTTLSMNEWISSFLVFRRTWLFVKLEQ